MIVITVPYGQRVRIGEAIVTLKKARGGQTRLVIDAPRRVRVSRNADNDPKPHVTPCHEERTLADE